jgi:pyridoxine/pyridoxamine 5'-phosphate oxidase
MPIKWHNFAYRVGLPIVRNNQKLMREHFTRSKVIRCAKGGAYRVVLNEVYAWHYHKYRMFHGFGFPFSQSH